MKKSDNSLRLVTPAEKLSEAVWYGEERFRLLVEGVRDYAIFMLDPDGRIVSWNRGAEANTGYKAEEIIGQPFSRLYPLDQIERGWPQDELRLAKADGRFEDEGWRIRKDGSQFWANVVITAIFDDAGNLRGYLKITRDLTERKRHEETLRRSEERFRLLVESVRDYAIFMLDPDGRIVSWNAGAEKIKGYKAEEIIGQHFSRFYPLELVQRDWPQQQLRIAKAEGRYEDEGWRVRKDGTRFWANVLITCLRDHEGHHRGFVKITRDLTERKRIEALEEGRRRINEFLAMLAHELRNPLAPIRNAVGIMRIKQLDDPSLEWARDVIDRQLAHLARLVDDLLDVSRITSGKVMLQKEPIEIAVVVARAVEASRPLIDARHHTLVTTLPSEPMLVEGDLTRLSQVVLNLLNNAAKYTPEGGRIELAVEKEGDNMVLRVRDSGIGIPQHMMAKVFDLFTQGDRSLDRSEGGLGVGLTLVRKLVEMHGGTVLAFSEGPGRGSEFIVRMPMLDGQTRHAALSRTHYEEKLVQSAHRRVLVVDDSRDSADSMAVLLRLLGHHVRSVYDGPSALTVAAEQRPELILLDIGLPGMDGYETAQELRRIPGLERAILVAVTGYGQEDDRNRALQAGFDHHLVKPVEFEALEELLEALPAPPPAA